MFSTQFMPCLELEAFLFGCQMFQHHSAGSVLQGARRSGIAQQLGGTLQPNLEPWPRHNSHVQQSLNLTQLSNSNRRHSEAMSAMFLCFAIFFFNGFGCFEWHGNPPDLGGNGDACASASPDVSKPMKGVPRRQHRPGIEQQCRDPWSQR